MAWAFNPEPFVVEALAKVGGRGMPPKKKARVGTATDAAAKRSQPPPPPDASKQNACEPGKKSVLPTPPSTAQACDARGWIFADVVGADTRVTNTMTLEQAIVQGIWEIVWGEEDGTTGVLVNDANGATAEFDSLLHPWVYAGHDTGELVVVNEAKGTSASVSLDSLRTPFQDLIAVVRVGASAASFEFRVAAFDSQPEVVLELLVCVPLPRFVELQRGALEVDLRSAGPMGQVPLLLVRPGGPHGEGYLLAGGLHQEK